MIQLKRGSTRSWAKNKTPLAAGQPGYDKDRHIIKVGDGEHAWEDLAEVGGVTRADIISSEEAAREKKNSAFGKLLNSLGIETDPIITYGTEAPSKSTTGHVYMQYCDGQPEADYVVCSAIDRGWTYRKWQSGLVECWGTFDFATAIQNVIEGSTLYYSNSRFSGPDYPVIFSSLPTETAFVHSINGIVWLNGNKNFNSADAKVKAASYTLISPEKLPNNTYKITINVSGRWK
jgi:hypothetical protein